MPLVPGPGPPSDALGNRLMVDFCRLESVLRRLQVGYDQHMTSDVVNRHLVLEAALGPIHPALTTLATGSSRSAPSAPKNPKGPATDTRLASAVHRLLASLPYSSHTWQHESRILDCDRAHPRGRPSRQAGHD